MTYQDLYQAAEDLLGDSTLSTEARLKKFINWAQQDITSRKDWSFLQEERTFNTVAATESYSLASGCSKIIDITDETSDTYLPEYSMRVFDKQNPSVGSSETGKPQYFMPTGTDGSGNITIRLFPIPDAVYTINYNYYKNAGDLSNAADLSIIPVKYHQLLVDYALSREYEHRRSSMANYYVSRYENGVLNMLTDQDLTEANNSMISPRGNRIGKDLRF